MNRFQVTHSLHVAIVLYIGLSSHASLAGEPKSVPDGRNIHLRGSLSNSQIQFETNKTGHVAFMGGSITEMNGYRPMVCEILQRRFPETEFKFTDAGISSTCSTTGAFRLATDVLSQGPVDLFFVEFAVNDDQDAGHARRECIRGMEGIVRHVRRYNHCADIVMVYFTNPEMVETIRNGGTPLSSGSHEEVAKHHDICSVDLAREVADRISEGTLTWQQYGGTHPAPRGNAICAMMIERMLEQAWRTPLPENARLGAYATRDKPLDANHYGAGRFVSPSSAKGDDDWELGVPDWDALPGQCRRRFLETALLSTSKPGAALTLEFDGKAVGAYVLAGPDAGIVEASVDGGPIKRVDLFHRFSRGLHYPRTLMFDTDLPPGRHVLELKMTGEKNEGSSGHAMRILQFAVN